MTLVSVRVVLATSGEDLVRLVGIRRNLIGRHREFSRFIVNRFAEEIEIAAPRDTGFMVKRMTTVRQIRGAGTVDGYGAGAYSLIGDPANPAKRGTIAAFIKANKKMRGSRPIAASGAWWTLTQAGKDKIRNSRRHGAYGGGKPAYWYAIVSGLVPSATGGTLIPDDFVTPAIGFANATRFALAKSYFGG